MSAVISAVVGFADALRARGVDASLQRVQAFVDALALVDATSDRDVYWAGRVTLCSDVADIATYDDVFAAFFRNADVTAPPRTVRPTARLRLVSTVDEDVEDDADGQSPMPWAAASRLDVLRHRDLADLSTTDRAALSQLMAAFKLRGDLKRTRRTTPDNRGDFDRRRIVRQLLHTGGEPVRLPRQRPRTRPRRVVLLVDVSGSMSPYADALLRFAHAAKHRRGAGATEIFTMGTRLTRVTRAMALRDPDEALRAAMQAVPDWSGGTRLGELVKQFLDGWGQRGLARSAVVVVLSDGWERDDVSLLREQMARLHRLAHRVVWANPRAGRPGFAPVASGMAAALPYVDDFVEGHTLAALEKVASVVAGAHRSARNPARDVAYA